MVTEVEPEPLTPADPGPVMVSWAHRPNPRGPDRPVTSEEWDAWRDTVLRFVTVLRGECGVTADLDLFQTGPVDWVRWGQLQIQQCPWTLVVVNAAWRERFEGRNEPTEGAGAVAEANVLHGLFQENPEDFHRRVLLVVLPGANEDDVPLQLRGVQRFTVNELTREGLDGLLRHLTGQPLYIPPPVGTVPVLPPRTLEGISEAVAAAQVATGAIEKMAAWLEATTNPAPGGERHAGAVNLSGEGNLSGQGHAVDADEDERVSMSDARALVQAALALSPALQDAPASSEVSPTTSAPAEQQWPQLQVLARALGLTANTAASSQLLEGPSSSGARDRDPRTAGAQRLGELLQGVSAHLARDNRCWVLVAGTLLTGAPMHPGDGLNTPDGRSQRRRREDQVSGWLVTRPPPVDLGDFGNTVRAPGRVVFTGNPGESRTAGEASAHWRLELADLGDVVAAASVAGEVSVPPDVGTIGWAGEPGEVLMDTELSLPVRRDLLEMWLLTLVELVTDYLRATATVREAVLALQAQLLLPTRLTRPATRRSTVLGVRLVDEHRDEDGHPDGERAPEGAVALPLGTAPPTTAMSTITLVGAWRPGAHVRIAHRLAVEVLEHFGVEGAAVLRADGTVDELAAAAADQQRLYQHACTLGLEVDPVSPEQRRQRYEELLAQARAALRR